MSQSFTPFHKYTQIFTNSQIIMPFPSKEAFVLGIWESGSMTDIFRTNDILHKNLKGKIEFKIVEWAEGVGVR